MADRFESRERQEMAHLIGGQPVLFRWFLLNSEAFHEVKHGLPESVVVNNDDPRSRVADGMKGIK